MTVALSVFKTSKEPFWDQLCLADYIWPVDHITYNAVDARRSNLGSVTHKKVRTFCGKCCVVQAIYSPQVAADPKMDFRTCEKHLVTLKPATLESKDFFLSRSGYALVAGLFVSCVQRRHRRLERRERQQYVTFRRPTAVWRNISIVGRIILILIMIIMIIK